MPTTDAAALNELDARWLRIGGGRPFVRPMLQSELHNLALPCPEDAAPLVLVELDPNGETVHR